MKSFVVGLFEAGAANLSQEQAVDLLENSQIIMSLDAGAGTLHKLKLEQGCVTLFIGVGANCPAMVI